MIPQLRPDGTLPPGIHQTTLQEILAVFPPRNEQRRILNDSLERVVQELQKLDPSIPIYVDGSYVTSKAEPNDVDVLVKSDQYQELEVQGYLDRVCPVEAVSVSVKVELTTESYLLDFMMLDRHNQPKGILLLV